jgi:RNA polymerase sigma factor (sigma-70 family)
MADAAEEFDDFYRRNHPALIRVLWRYVGNRTAAEDISHDAFMAAWRDWQTVNTREVPAAWVRRIALNRAASWLDRRRLELRSRRLWAAPLAQQTTDLLDPEFWAAVRTLTPRRAQAFALRYVEDWGYADIATTLGCSELSARQLVHRARAELEVRVSSTLWPRAARRG